MTVGQLLDIFFDIQRPPQPKTAFLKRSHVTEKRSRYLASDVVFLLIFMYHVISDLQFLSSNDPPKDMLPK